MQKYMDFLPFDSEYLIRFHKFLLAGSQFTTPFSNSGSCVSQISTETTKIMGIMAETDHKFSTERLRQAALLKEKRDDRALHWKQKKNIEETSQPITGNTKRLLCKYYVLQIFRRFFDDTTLFSSLATTGMHRVDLFVYAICRTTVNVTNIMANFHANEFQKRKGLTSVDTKWQGII